ncbi:MAG: AbrB/MazE/SpoVT family DNA-binding domain-containing protein [Geminicoccaceae bacterium]
MARTRLSSKGQLIIPKDIRDRRGWTAGTELELLDQGDVLVLRRADPPFARTTFEEVHGCLRYDGPPIALEELDKGIARHVRERWTGRRPDDA